MSESGAQMSLPTGWHGFAVRAALVGVGATLRISPRPTVWVIRRAASRLAWPPGGMGNTSRCQTVLSAAIRPRSGQN